MDEKDIELEKLGDTSEDNTAEENVDNTELEIKDGVKYETNDNWKFEAEAPTLDDSLFEGELKTPSAPVAAAPIEYKSPVAAPAEMKNSKGREMLHFLPTALLVLAIAVALIVLGVRYYTVPNGKEGKLMNPPSVVSTVDGTKVSIGMFNYYYSSMVTYYENYANYGYFDLDTTQDYDTQYTTDEDGNQITWKEFFEKETLKEIEQQTAYYTAALKNGTVLTDTQKETIDAQIESLKTSASSQGVALNDYIKTNFGEYCSESTLRLMLEQYYLSANYKAKLGAETEIAQDEIDAYFSENESKYYSINFSYLMLEYDSSSEETKANSDKILNDYLEKISDRNSMLDLVPSIYKTYIEMEVENSVAADDSVTEEEARETAIASYKERIDATISGIDTPFDEEMTNWLFSDETPVGSKKSYVDESTGTAYLILKTETATLLDDKTYSVRHILIQPEGDPEETDELGQQKYSEAQMAEAKAAAEEILNEFNNGDKTEYSFALLAEENSTDTASTSASANGAFGGLYEGVALGQMVPSFEEWSIDSERKYGDTGIVESDYGYHIMFFVNTCASYEAQIISELKAEKVSDVAENANIKHREKSIEKAIENFYASRNAASSADAAQ